MFLKLWLGIVSFELWLGIKGKHVAFLKLWLVRMSLDRLSSSTLVGEFGGLWTLRIMVHIGNSTWRYGAWSVAGLMHVFYKLWLVGVQQRGS